MSTDSFTTTNIPGTTTNTPGTAGKQQAAHSTDHTQQAQATPTSERAPICGEPVTLPTDIVLTALRYAHRPDIGPDDIRDVRCTLQVHPVTEPHYGFIVDTAPATAAWTRWANDAVPQTVLVLPDCSATDPGQDRVCSEYEGHRGGHTWQVEDPWNPQDVTVTEA